MSDPHYKNLHKALIWAAKQHKKQDREGADPLPYVTHPVEVVSTLRHVGGVIEEDMLVAAALHDLIEECGVDQKKITKKFGERVGALVGELTRHEPDAERLAELTEDEVAQLRSDILLDEIARMSPDAQMVKLADRISNVRGAMVAKEGEKLDRYIAQSRRILEIIPETVNPQLWRALREAIGAPAPAGAGAVHSA